MIRIKLSVLLFVCAAALLPQVAFASVSPMICRDDARPGTCAFRPEYLFVDTLPDSSEAPRSAHPAADTMWVGSRAPLPEMAFLQQTAGTVVHRTFCADDADAQSCVVRSAQPYAGRSSQRVTAYGAADVNPSVTAGAVGIGQTPPAPHRHAPSGGYGPHYTEQ